MGVANNLLDAIDILAENKVAAVKFDKTVRATIDEVVDASIGKYKVKYQNSIFFAYALDLKTYSKGVQVYVVIPSSDFNKDPYITGTVKKSAATATDVITQADRMTIVGTNVLDMTSHIGFCSYKTNDSKTRTKDLMELTTIDTQGLTLYKKDSDYIQIGATFQTKLDNKQRVGAGNYGIRILCSYYNSKYTEEERITAPLIPRVYELNVNNMVGNPYSFGVPSRQSVLFEIDSANLCSIDGIEAFCENFPYSNAGSSENCTGYLNPNNYILYSDSGFTKEINLKKDLFVYDKITEEWYAWNPDRPQPDRQQNGGYDINKTDIILSNLFFEFYDALTEDELNGLSLRATTPYGNYFYTNTNTGRINPEKWIGPEADDYQARLILHGDLRVKGKSVNYKEQEVHFYWFIKDNSITAISSGYNKYGGTGWRCLNTPYYSGTAAGAGTSYSPDTYDKEINFDLCAAKETQFKCVAVFKDGTDTVSADNTITVYNKTDTTSPEVTLQSTMGADFSFNEGQTDIVCYIDGKTQGDLDFNLNINDYSFYWTYSVDAGNPQPIAATEEEPMKLKNVDVADSYKFVTYECTVKQKTSDGEVDFGSAVITLTNGEPNGQYSLIIKNGTQVFQYTKEGVSPTSPTLDEFDRITLPQLAFDIYNDKGQLISFGSDEEKIKRMNIRWIWPGSKNPYDLAQNETMLVPFDWTEEKRQHPEEGEFKTYDFPDPSTNSTNRKYVLTKKATLQYKLSDSYDLTKYDNNIILEIDYNNQHLSASTNFTFTKDGEAGTNGTKYLTRIVPFDNYEKVVIRNDNGYKLQGVSTKENGGKNFATIGTDGKTNVMPFKAQIWDGSSNPYKTITHGNSINWSTSLQDRGKTGMLFASSDKTTGLFNVSNTFSVGNQTAKVAVTDNGKVYHASYPVEIYVNPNYYIDGGYRNCSYESDGTRSAYNQQPFTVRKVSDGSLVTGTWTISWGDSTKMVSKYHNDARYVLIEPPSIYKGENINHYITCSINDNPVAYISIEFYLDRYGLSGLNDWDGSSIKINQDGSKYILAPQIGAGHKDPNNNSFTGITMGEVFESNTSTPKTGLFGYDGGQRSIFLDAQTGDAIFGKTNGNQIKLDASEGSIDISTADGDGMTLSGNSAILQSHNYSTTDGKGMRISLSEPSIKFGSGHFSVSSSGNITAVDGGTIANWHIGTNTLSSGNVELNSSTTATYAIKAGTKDGPTFTVTPQGYLTSISGKIAGWDITGSEIKNTAIFMHKDGYIGGGTGGTYNNIKSHNNLRWYINSDGIAHFSDLEINNDTSRQRVKDQEKKIIDLTKTDGKEGFWVKNNGSMKATAVDITGKVTADEGKIGGWRITKNTIQNDNGYTLTSSSKNNPKGKVNLGSGFVASSSSMSGDGTFNGTTSGSGSGFALGSGSGNQIAGTTLDDSTGYWWGPSTGFTSITQHPTAKSWKASDYYVIDKDGKKLTLQGGGINYIDSLNFVNYTANVFTKSTPKSK